MNNIELDFSVDLSSKLNDTLLSNWVATSKILFGPLYPSLAQ